PLESGDCPDGAIPLSGVTLGKAGTLYGSTFRGGVEGYWGLLYKLSPNSNAQTWIETVLFKFLGKSGGNPLDVILDQTGNAYMAAYAGTPGTDSACGGVFEFTTNPEPGKRSRLFTTAESGCNPLASVSIDPKTGNVYGTASAGGQNGGGTIYEVSKTGKLS